MADTPAAALAFWFREASATSAYAGEVNDSSVIDKEGMLFLDAANLADDLPPGDYRLARLAEAGRFTVFYGDLVFVGGGNAVRHATVKAIKSPGADGRFVLDAVITAALSEAPPV